MQVHHHLQAPLFLYPISLFATMPTLISVSATCADLGQQFDEELVSAKTAIRRSPRINKSVPVSKCAKVHQTRTSTNARRSCCKVAKVHQTRTNTKAAPRGAKRSGVKRSRRPYGSAVIKEIKKYQKTTNLLSPKGTMSKFMTHVLHDHLGVHGFLSARSVDMMHELAETHLTTHLMVVDSCARHANRKSASTSDLKFTKEMMRRNDIKAGNNK